MAIWTRCSFYTREKAIISGTSAKWDQIMYLLAAGLRALLMSRERSAEKADEAGHPSGASRCHRHVRHRARDALLGTGSSLARCGRRGGIRHGTIYRRRSGASSIG